MDRPVPPEVRAAGGVVLRPAADGAAPDVLVVHRPSYDDWSLPKGKLDPGETWEEAAVREIHEETGVTARLGVELTPTRYVDGKDRSKHVRWWTMTALDDEHRPPDDEVDELRWVPVGQARDLLTYGSDRDLVDEALAARDHVALLVVRHAHAGERDGWRGDDRLRPLSTVGHQQAEAIAEQLAPWMVARIVSSPLVRCVQTLEPLAEALGAEILTDERLAEGASPEATADLLRDCPSGTVLCSHGDVIGDLVERLADLRLVDRRRASWEKGSTWVVQLDGDRRATHATYLPPPA